MAAVVLPFCRRCTQNAAVLHLFHTVLLFVLFYLSYHAWRQSSTFPVKIFLDTDFCDKKFMQFVSEIPPFLLNGVSFARVSAFLTFDISLTQKGPSSCILLKKRFVALGCITALGTIGTPPILPTVPFYLLTAFCFAVATAPERLHTWFTHTTVCARHRCAISRRRGMTCAVPRRSSSAR